MRWIWIDRFEVFEPKQRAVAIKNLTLAEEHLHDHFPGYPIMPATLMIEGMAQTAGILVGHARNFAEKVILAKIRKASFNGLARPGDQLRYEAVIENIADAGASTHGVITKNGEPFGEVDLFFSHIDQNMRGTKFPEENFVFTEQFMSLLRAYNVE
jgi:3-hydroxyacyl-[acyl-carrier-protein] dehydratase